jgi:RNA polymerase sigma-70 factor, ECF subfamily
MSAGSAAAVPRRRIEPTETDGELVRRARGGDKWAEEALYDRHVRPVTRLSLRLLGRSAEAEDVVQDAFIIALSSLDKLKDEEAFGGWLRTIAVHQVRRRFRKRALLRTLGLDRGTDDITLAEQADQAASPEVRATLAEIDAVLERLPAKVRVAWVLRCVEGHELTEAATLCGCSLATVKRLIGRAQQTIAEHLAVASAGGEDG